MSLCTVAVVIGFSHTALAAEADAEESTAKLLTDINTIFNQILRLSSAWLWPVLLMIGSLLDNDLIFGGAMGERLQSIWVQIRNLVNIIFVLVLLAIAVYNVLGLGEEGGTLPLAFKTVMPKFVLALIAVNFSFLAVKVVLDFSNVVTGAVFALPTTVLSRDVKLDELFEKTVCGITSKEISLKPTFCDGNKINARAKNFFSRLDRSNITLVYAIRFARAPQLKFIRDGLQGIGQLGFNIIFNTVLYVVYALSFIALFLVLLFRLVALWIAVVLSPLLALSIVLPNLKELAGGSGEFQKKFVQSVIAPITIGLVLSVGYIMLDGFEADKSIHGALLSSISINAADPNALPTDISDLQQLMIAIGVIVIVWTGVFGAAKETVAGAATEFIKTHAENFGRFAAKLPTYLQVIPTKRGERTLMQLWKTPQLWKEKIERERGIPPEARDLRYIVDNFRQERRKVNSPEDAANLFLKSPTILADPIGRSEFKEMLKDSKVAALGLAATIDKLDNPREIVEKIYSDTSEFGAKVKSKKASSADLIEQIRREAGEEAVREKPVTPPSEPKKAVYESLQKKTAKAGEGSFVDWKDQKEIDILAGLSERIYDALVEVKDGKVVKLSPDQINAATSLANALRAASDQGAVTKAIDEAKRNKLDTAQVEKLIAASDISDAKLKDAASKYNKK